MEEDLQELLRQAIVLVETVEEWQKSGKGKKFHDYSFVVFPAAKGFEGFLKKLFLDLGFISEDDYFGKRFRIGKSLNPSLDRIRRARYGVYDKVVKYCRGNELADAMWETWKLCRNQLFHWFPNEKHVVSFTDAKNKVQLIFDTVDLAFKECKVTLKS